MYWYNRKRLELKIRQERRFKKMKMMKYENYEGKPNHSERR